MSETVNIFENDENLHQTEDDDEPLDPRIQIELESANAACTQINHLETELDTAQRIFQMSFNNYKHYLAKLAKSNSRSIERARPYYNACQKAKEAQIDTQQAAHEYQDSVEFYHTAQENLTLAQIQKSQSDLKSWQEFFDQAKQKLGKAEQDRKRCEQVHEEKSKSYQEFEQQRVSLSRSLKRSITKSKNYFDLKRRAEFDLKNQKIRIEEIQKTIRQEKISYRAALNRLEQISEEIHSKRAKNCLKEELAKRDVTIDIEQTDTTIEIPVFELNDSPLNELSDECSDSELSNPIKSLSINELPNLSTNCRLESKSMPQIAN